MTVSATTTLTSDHSAPAADASTRPSSDDVGRTGDVLPQPTAGDLPDCVFVDTDALVDDSLSVPIDIRHRTTETDGHAGYGRYVVLESGSVLESVEDSDSDLDSTTSLLASEHKKTAFLLHFYGNL